MHNILIFKSVPVVDIFQQLRAIIKGEVSTVTDLNINTVEQSLCKVIAGSAGIPTYTEAYTDANKSIFSSPSSIENKFNYFSLYESGNRLYFQTGDSISGSDLTNPSTIELTGLTEVHLNISNKHCLFYSGSIINGGIELTQNPYDVYSNEAKFKRFRGTNTLASLYAANFYDVLNNTYQISREIPVHNIVISNIGISKNETRIDNMHMMVPLNYHAFDLGWLGGDISNLSGLYISTTGAFETEKTVKHQDITYYVWANSTTKYLIKE